MGAQKSPLNETVLLSTHNICFGWEIRKFIFYTLLTNRGPKLHKFDLIYRNNMCVSSNFEALSFSNIYILIVVALDETITSNCLHFSMQNIEMLCDLDCTSGRRNLNVCQ